MSKVLTLLISLCCSLLLFCSLLRTHLNRFFSVLKDLHIVLIGSNAAYLKICVYERGGGEHKPDEAREGTWPPGARVTESCEPPRIDAGTPNSGPRKKQQTESSPLLSGIWQDICDYRICVSSWGNRPSYRHYFSIKHISPQITQVGGGPPPRSQDAVCHPFSQYVIMSNWFISLLEFLLVLLVRDVWFQKIEPRCDD